MNLNFTRWLKKSPIEQDTDAECGHRCIHMDGGERTPFCDRYKAANPNELGKFDKEAFTSCPNTGTGFSKLIVKSNEKILIRYLRNWIS